MFRTYISRQILGRKATGNPQALLWLIMQYIDGICQYEEGDWKNRLDSLSIGDIVQVIQSCTDICNICQQTTLRDHQNHVVTSYQTFMNRIAQGQDSNDDFLFLFLRYRYLGFELICQAFRLLAKRLLAIEEGSEQEKAILNPLVQLVRERNRLTLDFLTDYIRINSDTKCEDSDDEDSGPIFEIVRDMRRIKARCELDTILPEEDFNRIYFAMMIQVAGTTVADYLNIWSAICQDKFDEAQRKIESLDFNNVIQDVDLIFCRYAIPKIVNCQIDALSGLKNLSDLGYAKAGYQLGWIYQGGMQYANGSTIKRHEQLAQYYFKQAFLLQGDHFFPMFSSLSELLTVSCPLLTQVQNEIFTRLAWVYDDNNIDQRYLRLILQQVLLLFIDSVVKHTMQGEVELPLYCSNEQLCQALTGLLNRLENNPFAQGNNAQLLVATLNDVCPFISKFLQRITTAQLEDYWLLDKIIHGELIKIHFHRKPSDIDCLPSSPAPSPSLHR